MNKLLINILTIWIPIKSIRHKIRNKLRNNISNVYYRVFKQKYVKNITKKIEKYGSCIAIQTISFDCVMFQRPQHLFLKFAEQKQYCLYFSYYYKPEYKQYNEYLDLADFYLFLALPKDILSKITLIVSLTSSSFTYKQLLKLQKKSIKIIIEYLDEISKKISGNISIQLENYKNLEKINPFLIITTTRKLQNEMLARFPKEKVILAQNAVNIHDFINVNSSIPNDLEPILAKNKPIVGYYGAMAGWLDWELINKMSKERPNCEFVYIGIDYQNSLKNLKKLENVHFLGSKNYKDLPKYSQYFNCCIIPFGDKDIAESTSPLKLFEYMAIKKPVVCTKDLLECYGYEGVLMSNTHEDFISNLDLAIQMEKDEKIKEKLFEYAKQNTWEKRAGDILNRIKKLNEQKIINIFY